MGMYDYYGGMNNMNGIGGMNFIPQSVMGYNPQPQGNQQQMVPRQNTQTGPTMRIVENEGIVGNIEVPMDGTYYFLKADGKEIYAKYWTREMKTRIDKFVLVSQEVEQSKPNMEDVIKGYFDNMEDNICSRLDNLEMKLERPVNKTTTKTKEV